MSILTQAIDKSRKQVQQQGEGTSILRLAIDRARQGEPVEPVQAQNVKPFPVPGAAGRGTQNAQKQVSAQPAAIPSVQSPSPAIRSTQAVRQEMDGVDKALKELRARQSSLNGQIQHWTSGAGPRDHQSAAAAGRQAYSRAQDLRDQAKALEEEIARLEKDRAGLETQWEQADAREFGQLKQTQGFKAAVKQAMEAPYGHVSAVSRKPSHRDVGHAMTYFQAIAKGDIALAEAAKSSADMALDRMSQDQRDRLAYYVGIGDYDSAADHLNKIAPALNQEQAENLEQKLSEWSQEHPILGTGVNVVSWPMNIPAYFANATQAAKNAFTGKNEKDPHGSAYGMAKIGTGTSQGVSEAARGAATQTFGSEKAGDAAAFLAGTGLSIGQNAAQIAALGPYSLAGMAMSAAGSETAEALGRGATPGQAFALGTASGTIEALTEKLPLDNLFQLAKEGGGKGVKAAALDILKQMGTEATEEAISEIAGNIADAAVMGDQSELKAYIRELQAAGMSKEEAERAAALRFYGVNVGLAALGGGISGGVMGGGAMALGRTGGQTAQGPADTAIDRAYAAMGEQGMFSQEAQQAAKTAAESLERTRKGPWDGIYLPRGDEGTVALPTAEDAVQAAQEGAERAQTSESTDGPQEARRSPGGTLAEQIAFVERNLRESYERGDISEEGYLRSLAKVRADLADIASSPEALAAVSPSTPQAEQAPAQQVRRVDGGQSTAGLKAAAMEAPRLQEIAAQAQALREDYARGRIGDAAFDQGMDSLQTEAELTGMEASEAQKLLDGGLSYMAEGRMNDGTGTAAGEQLSGGDGGRVPGAGAGGEAASLGAGGPQGSADASGGTGYRADLGQPVRTEAVSSRELGLVGGTDAKTVRVLSEESWNGELRSIARQVRRETGLSVRFTLGPMEMTRGDGQIRQVRGVYNENGIFVQADNGSATAKQIAAHEIFHSYAQSDPGLVQAAEAAITERYGREEMRDILAVYAKNLRGIADVSELDTMNAQALADIKNELLADAFAGINAFGAQAGKYQDTVYETLEDRGADRPQGRENAQAMDKRGPPSKLSEGPPDTYSIDYDQDNRPFVTVEEDILDGVPREDWARTVKDNLRKKYPNGVTVGNNEIKITGKSRGEMTFSQYTRWLMETQPEVYADKLRAVNDADELLFASRDWVNEALLHPRKDDINDFARGTVQIRVGGNDYTAQVIVGNRRNGSLLLYDVINLTPTEIQQRKQKSNAAVAVNPSPGVDRSTASGFIDNTIAQDKSAVKPWVGTLPRGTDRELTLPGGQERYSAQEEVVDAQDLPTLKEAQAKKVDVLPAKARDYLQRAERRLIGRIGELLSVPRSAQRQFLQDIVRDMSVEYLETGRISQETRERLFEQGYEQGVQVDREYYDNYKHVRDYLRSTPITISEKVKGDITDYGAWRKNAFGTLRLVKDGGIGADTAYMELQHMAPGLFPDDITHPADQLRHILETAKGIRAAEQNLDEFYGPDAAEFKRLTRRDFDEAVADLAGELRQVKRYTDEQTLVKEQPQIPTTPQEAAELYRRKKGAQQVYQRAAARNLLTDHDQIQVGRLLRGELELEHLDPAKDNVRGITAVYESKLEYEQLAGQIREWNSQRKAQLRAEADGFLETANQWKDKAAGILYSRETMERNIRDIVPDQDLADRINKRYFQPVHQAAAEANKTKNQYRDRVRALKLSRKKAAGNAVSEAHAVQLLGEAEDNIRWLQEGQGRRTERDGKTLQEWHAVIGELWENSPNLDQDKIRGAVQEFRAIYDELFQQMNEARVRNGYEPVSYRQGYFPHFQADSEGLMAQFGRALGIDTAVTNLPTTINGLTHTFKPGIQWFGNALERKGFDTAYDAVQGFDRYIEGAADVIHQTDNIQALRVLAAQARYRTGDEGLRQQVDRVRANENLTDQEKQALIDEIHKEGRFALSNFVVELDEYTNLLANKKSRADRNMEQALGRRMYNIVKGLESRVAANMVAINPASWLTNFVPLTQGWGTVKTRFMLEGMWDTLKAVKADDGMVGMSSFLTNRRGSDPIVKTWQQGASAVLSTPMEWIDCFTADSLVRARFKQNQAAGLSEAASIEEADAWAAGVMADRSKGATPTLFNRSNPLTKVFTQFQLEVNNQLSYLFKDLPSDLKKKGLAALCAMLFKVFIGAYLYNDVYEYFIGRRCALDPIGILNDSVGDFTGYQMPNLVGMAVDAAQGNEISFETEKKKPFEAVTGLGKNVAEELPFIGGVLGGGRVPISSAMPDWENLAKASVNNEWDGKKRAATAVKALSGPATYLALPFGGGQVKKIYQGLKTVHEGGSWTVDNKGQDILQYPVFNETAQDKLLTLPTALAFGKSALPTAREWAERGYKGMSAKQTACYQGMTGLGVTQRDAYQLLQELGDVEAPTGEDVPDTDKAAYQKRKLLQEADISAQGKGVVYYTLMASDRERKLMDSLNEGGADMGEAAKVLMELKDAGAELKGKELSAAKKGAIAGSSLSEEEKNQLFCFMLGKDSKGAALAEELKKAGLSKGSSAAVANAVNALTPEKGKDTVSDAQKWRAVVDTARGAADQKAALLTVMSDSARMRYKIGTRYGIQPEAWVQVKEALPQFDANKNGSYSSGEIEKAIDALAGDGHLLAPWDKDPIRLSREEKAVLWQLFTGSTSGSGNPYST